MSQTSGTEQNDAGSPIVMQTAARLAGELDEEMSIGFFTGFERLTSDTVVVRENEPLAISTSFLKACLGSNCFDSDSEIGG
jgi:hypothetical protein